MHFRNHLGSSGFGGWGSSDKSLQPHLAKIFLPLSSFPESCGLEVFKSSSEVAGTVFKGHSSKTVVCPNGNSC